MPFEISLFFGLALGLFSTYSWVKMREANINYTSRIAIATSSILCLCGFSMNSDPAWNMTGLCFSFLLFANLYYLMIIESKGNKDLKHRLNFMRGWKIFDISVFISILIATPGYTISFLNHPVARVLIVLALTWQWLGIFIYSRPWKSEDPIETCSLYTIFVFVFMTPILFLPSYGPLLVTASF